MLEKAITYVKFLQLQVKVRGEGCLIIYICHLVLATLCMGW
jgi:hypothetical protein